MIELPFREDTAYAFVYKTLEEGKIIEDFLIDVCGCSWLYQREGHKRYFNPALECGLEDEEELEEGELEYIELTDSIALMINWYGWTNSPLQTIFWEVVKFDRRNELFSDRPRKIIYNVEDLIDPLTKRLKLNV